MEEYDFLVSASRSFRRSEAFQVLVLEVWKVERNFTGVEERWKASG